MKGSGARTLLALTGLAVGFVLAGAGPAGRLSDEDVSLRREGLLELTTPAPVVYEAPEAGDSKPIARAYYGAPPLIPHAVAGQAIGLRGNDCLDCHEEGDTDTPGLPPSHRIKALFRLVPRAESEAGATTVFEGFAQAERVSGNRYDCLLCHVPQATGAKELVRNGFTPVQPKDAHKDNLEPLESVGEF